MSSRVPSAISAASVGSKNCAHLVLLLLSACRPKDITWHEDNWHNPDSRFLAWTLHDTHNSGFGCVYIAFNAHPFEVKVSLPKAPQGRKWCRLVDTNLPSPRDFTPGGNAGVDAVYGVASYSAIVLVSKQL